MSPEFYSLQMNVTGGVDTCEWAFYLGRFGRPSANAFSMLVYMSLIDLAHEENQ